MTTPRHFLVNLFLISIMVACGLPVAFSDELKHLESKNQAFERQSLEKQKSLEKQTSGNKTSGTNPERLAKKTATNISQAEIRIVWPVDDLQVVIDTARPGDHLQLKAGIYKGNFSITKPLKISGSDNTVLDGLGRSHVVSVESSGVTIDNLKIRNWGDDLTETNAGIYIKNTRDVRIEENELSGDGFGIYIENSKNIYVKGNRIQGNDLLRSADRGNGIHLVNVENAFINDNTVWHTRDGLYIINSRHNELKNNLMKELRYGIHYMYSDSNKVIGNKTSQVRVGYALMSSRNLTIRDNRAEDCDDYGLLLNFVTYSTFQGNQINTIRIKEENIFAGGMGKALFVYNSQFNEFTKNTFSNSDLGVHLTAGSEGNKIYANNFVSNKNQVKYVATRHQEWSEAQQGNYWSNYMGWDLDQNGIGDTAFEPNDGIDKLLWKYPEAKVLMDSPAILLLRWVQRSFPVLKTPGVKDSYPLFKPITKLKKIPRKARQQQVQHRGRDHFAEAS